MDIKVFDLVRQIKRETGMMLDYHEAYQLYMCVKRTEKINGDLAEVGTYRGGSAKLICEAKGERPLYVFDTFDEGFPKPSLVDDLSLYPHLELYEEGMYATSFEDVKKLLTLYPQVHLYKGLFPSTAEPIKNKKFSFVNLDVDLYESTLSCLQFFYPRLNRGGAHFP